VSEQQPDRDDDDAWLLARERGQSGPTISDASAARYTRLGTLIAELPPAPDIARADWEQRVLATIEAELTEESASERSITSWRRWPVPLAAAASLLIIVGILASRDRSLEHRPVDTGTYALTVVVEQQEGTDRGRAGSGADRGTRAKVGDKLVIRGAAPQHAELRVYDEAGIEQARCASPGPDCSAEGSGQQATLQLTMVPRVRSVLRPVMFASPLGQTSRGYDTDVAAAEAAGIKVITHDPVHVR
jgi:hypothetical protein